MFALCNSAEIYSNRLIDEDGRLERESKVRSTLPNVHRVMMRNMAAQMPISPSPEFTGLPQKLVIALEEADQNNRLLRQSICLLSIDKPGDVRGREVSVQQSSDLLKVVYLDT